MNKKNINRFNVSNLEMGVRVTMLSVFLLSSVMKAVNINSFVMETRLYMDAYFWDLKSVMSGFGTIRIEMTGAIGVCVIEMLVALLAILHEYRRVASVGFCVMLTFFVYLTGLNLFFPTIMGSIESCGCFGELIHFSPLASFIKSVVLWVLSIVLVVYSWHERWNVSMLLKDRYLYICIATSVMLPLYSIWFFEALSHTVYIIGFVVLVVILTGNIIVWRVKQMSKE
jgi:hypothetical protein